MSGRNATLLLVAVCLGMLLPNLDSLPVNIMEARNFVTAREMANDGNWILTTLNGQPRYEKPPLPTWITALSGMIFGFENVFAMRLPVIVSALLLVFFAFKLCGTFDIPKRQKIASCLILVTSLYIWFSGRDNQWDLYCHAFMLGGIYYLRRLFESDQDKFRNAALAAVFIGFSMLSKGPISIYGLLLPFLIAYGAAFGYRNQKKRLAPILVVIVVALAIGLSWPLYVRFADPDTFSAIAAKEAARWKSYNTRPLYYYWNFFLQSGIWAVPSLIALFYRYMKSRVPDLKTYKLTFWWTIASLVLLSLIPEKKSRYLLPVLIPMAFNTGFYIEYLFSNFSKSLAVNEKRWVFIAFGILGFVGLAFPIVLFKMIPQTDSATLFWSVLSSATVAVCGFFIWVGLLKFRFSFAFWAAIMLQVSVVAFAFPLSEIFLRPNTYKTVDEVRRIALQHQVKVYEFGNFSPEIVYAFGQKIPESTPIEANFGILAMAGDSLNVRKSYPTAKKVSFINLNTSKKRARQPSNRLYRDFYLVFR